MINQTTPTKYDLRDQLKNSEISLNKTVLSYDANVLPPRRGELSIELENSKLNFFQMKAR